MKKILFLCIVCMLIMSGCSSKGIGLTEDKKYLDQLSSDPYTVDFVLEDVYYKLPCELKQFMDNGWNYEYGENNANKYDLSSITLSSKQQMELTLKKANEEIKVKVVNETNKPMTINEKTMIGYVWVGRSTKNDNFIVMRGGIRGNVNQDDIITALEKIDGFEQDDKYFMISQDEINYYEINTHEEVATTFVFNIYKENHYETYKSVEDKTADTKASTEEAKRKCEEMIKQYPVSKYKDFVKALEDNKNQKIKNYYGEFSIVSEKSVSNMVPLFSDGAYLIKDESGNYYAMYNDSLKDIKTSLKVGDKIKVWSSIDLTDAVVKKETDNIPLLSPLIIELGDKEIYNFFS